MARPSSDKPTRRMLSLILLLSEEDTCLDLEEIATYLGVDEDTALKDLNKLACCGVDDELMRFYVETVSGRHVTVVWGGLPALDKPLRLTVREARALIAALNFADIAPDDPLLNKLMQAVGPQETDATRIANLIYAGNQTDIASTLSAISQSIATSRVIEISHSRPGHDEPTTRLVEPHQLIDDQGTWYFIGWCRKANDLRTFRVDRISQATLTQETAAYRELPIKTAPIDLTQANSALVVVHDESVLLEQPWPGLTWIDDIPQDLNIELRATDKIASLPLVNLVWASQQIAATLGAVEALSPPDLCDAVEERLMQLATWTA